MSGLVRKAFGIIHSEGFSAFAMRARRKIRRYLKGFKIKPYQDKLLKENEGVRE